MKRFYLLIIAIIFSVLLNAQSVFTVTKTTDPNPFDNPYNFVDSLCDTAMYGTLQWAVRKVNDTPTGSIINFDIPGSGVQEIKLNTYLPQITQSVIIDATTQTGYQKGNPTIVINGDNNDLGGITFSAIDNKILLEGFNFYGVDNYTVKGIGIKNFTERGIRNRYCTNAKIIDCVINGIHKIVSENLSIAISFYESTNAEIYGNIIGFGLNATQDGISDAGIVTLTNSYNNFIGDIELNKQNTIRNCEQAGIYIGQNTNQNKISGNVIFDNTFAILLADNGNNAKTAPDSLMYDENTGLLTGIAEANDIIEIFGSTGDENANEYLTTVIADVNGNWQANITSTTYEYFVATATDAVGNSSGLSGVSLKTLACYCFFNETIYNPTQGYQCSDTITVCVGQTIYINIPDNQCIGDEVIDYGGLVPTTLQPTYSTYDFYNQTYDLLEIVPTNSGVFNIVVSINSCQISSGYHSCTFYGTIHVLPQPNVTLSANPTPSCFGDDIQLTASPSNQLFDYDWSNVTNSWEYLGFVNNVTSTETYSVTVTDDNGCTNSADITVPVYPELTPTITGDNEICLGESTTISVDTYSSYIWNTGETTQQINVSPTATTTYTVTVTNDNGCTGTASYTVTVNNPPNIFVEQTNNCQGQTCNGSAEVFPQTLDITYYWSTGIISPPYSINNLCDDTYTVTATNSNGCSTIETFTITTNPNPTIGISTNDAGCYGECNGLAAIYFIAPGGPVPPPVSYDLTPQSGFLNPINPPEGDLAFEDLCANDYNLVVTDGNGCSSSYDFTINQNTEISITETINNISCYGLSDGSINLFVTGGTSPYSYQWSTGGTSDNISDLSAGTYTVTVSDANNCIIIENYTVLEPNEFTISTTSTNNTSCIPGTYNGTASVTNIGIGINYLWSTGQIGTTINNLDEGIYTVTATNIAGCTAINQVVVEGVDINITLNVSDIDCEGDNDGIITANPIGGTTPYSYIWSNTSTTQTITNLTSGNYTVTIIDANSCSAYATTTISQGEAIPEIIDYEIVEADCDIGEITITNVNNCNNCTYTWSNGSSGSSINAPIGLYTVTVTSQIGCSTTGTYNIEEACGCDLITVFQDDDVIGITLINSYTNWSLATTGTNSYHFNTDVVITDNGLLDIEDFKVTFTPGHGIYMAGGRLNAVNSTFTNECDDLWKGIWNGPNMPENTVIFDNVLLENAEKGIHFIHNGSNNIHTSNNTHFTNNIYDIYLLNNWSGFVGFEDTYFETTSNLLGGNYPISHVYLDNSKVNYFSTCNFYSFYPIWLVVPVPQIPTLGILFPLANRGIGIHSINSKFKVGNESNFEKLYFGIKIEDTGINLNAFGSTVLNSTFTGNHRAILAEDHDEMVIEENSFYVWSELLAGSFLPPGASPQNSPNLFGYGVYMNSSESFSIKRNYFDGNNGDAYVGLYINNCGAVAEPVKNNIFSRFKNSNIGTTYKSTAVTILGNNGSGNTGLELKCNDFGYTYDGLPNYEKNNYDIAIIGATVKDQQGLNINNNVTAPANNRFSYFDDTYCTNGNNAIYSTSSQNVDYFIYGAAALNNPYNTDFQQCRSGIINGQNVQMTNLFDKQDACGYTPPPIQPLVITGGAVANLTQFSNYINNQENEVAILRDELVFLVDKRHTEQLLNSIANASFNNYRSVVKKIMKLQGYVSDTVIMSFMHKDVGRPISKTIALMYNSPLPKLAKNEIENTELPQVLKDYLQYFQNGLNVREQKEYKIGNYKQEENRAIGISMHSIADNDTLNIILDAVINELDNREDLFIQEKVLDLLLYAGRYNDARNKLNTLSYLSNSLSQEEIYDYNDWILLQELSIDIAEADSSIVDSLISENQQFLITLAETEFAKGQIQAQLLLEYANIQNFHELIMFPDENYTRNMFVEEFSEPSISSELDDLLLIYPNPVKDVLTVEYALLANANLNSISIYNLQGKLVKSVNISEPIGIREINLTDLNEGMYILSFGKDGVKTYSKKFTIKK